MKVESKVTVIDGAGVSAMPPELRSTSCRMHKHTRALQKNGAVGASADRTSPWATACWQ
jgi:hypothetical protein